MRPRVWPCLLLVMSAGWVLVAEPARAQMSFDDGALYPTTPALTGDVSIRDFNRDGHLDVVAALQTGFAVFLGNGDGTLGPAATFPAPGMPYDLAAADFNEDGALDLALSSQSGPAISVALGHGDGTFGLATTLPAGTIPYYLITADLDGDGHSDIITSDYFDATLSVFRGRGDGTFEPRRTIPVPRPSSAAAADLDGDGDLDVAVTGETGPGTVTVLLNDGVGGLHDRRDYVTHPLCQRVVVAHVNGDGLPDLVTAAPGTSGRIDVLLGSGSGFVQAWTHPGVTHDVALADFDGSGTLDIASTRFSQSRVVMFSGAGDGTFSPALELSTVSGPLLASVADLDGDHRTDLVLVRPQAHGVMVLLNTSAALDADGDGAADDVDNCLGVPNPDQVDRDLDGFGDVCDLDLDGDGVANELDVCPEVADGQQDTDGDGRGDACDDDDDGDGVNDGDDNCLGVSNTSQADSDGDGYGDACDDDDDGDGVDDRSDNCALLPNSAQTDSDGDGEGDVCDGDVDGDGVENELDLCPATPPGPMTDDAGCSGAEGVARACVSGSFANHGRYVSCVAQAANAAYAAGLLTAEERARLVSQAARDR